MKITIQDIKNNIYSSYYSRGLNYYAQGKIKKFEIGSQDENYTTFRASVKGSGGEQYELYIEIENEDDTVIIKGQCSCPIGYNCKHVAAVCMKYRADSSFAQIDKLREKIIVPSNSSSQVDRWLESLNIDIKDDSRDLDSTQAYKKSGEYFLTYRLFDTNHNTKDDILFFKSKYLKNGSISQGSKLNAENLVNNDYGYSTLTKESKDEAVLQLLKGSFTESRYYYNNRDDVKLEGNFGYIVLKELLKTNRCYFSSNKAPLVFENTPFKSNFNLKLYKKLYSIKSNINDRDFKILDTKPPIIIDILNNKVQELDIDMKTYKKLSTAPKIEKKDIAKVYTSISKAIPNLDLETPKEMKIVTLEVKPIPHLHLQYTKEYDSKDFHSFSIDFKYDRYFTHYNPREKSVSFFENDSKIELIRDLTYEESIKKQIERFGFEVEYKNDNIYVTLKDENKQKQLAIWKQFLNTEIEQLKNDGWVINYDEEFDLKFESNSEVVVESEDSNGWFNLSFNLEFNGVSQPIAPLVAGMIEEFDNFENMPQSVNIEVDENHFVEVQTSQLQPIIKTIIELFNKKDKDENLQLSAYDAHLLEFMDDDVIWRGSKEILELSQKLKDFQGIQKVEVPQGFNATLRDYQQDGLNWLNFLYEFKFGGILADDMGLGKTIQALVHLSKLKEDGKLTKPSLIVMPTSLIANWKNEIKKFTPNLSALSLHGSDRASRFSDINEYDILLTTYPLVVRDKEKFDNEKFLYIILDEAQKIKNHKTKMAIALKTFKCEYRLALSGTPIENHLGELWSIFSFLMPGFLDTNSFFKTFYQNPIEKEHDFSRQNLLNKRVKPFMIRRTKEKVASELPAKSEIIKYTQFENKQSKLYESIRVTMEEKVRQAVESKGLGSSHITILDALLKLRQVCCDPSLLKIQEAQKVHESAKLELFLDLVDELLGEGRKILVFSQFTSMLAIIEERIKLRNISYAKLTGSTRKREEQIEKFTKGDSDIFLISLKAGGVGLNLVEADTVIHYDPWWNPAVENQATDRAYRIGQTKAVFVYKLIVENTIEQKILEMQKKKQLLQDGIYDEEQQQDDMKFSGNELLELLQ